MAATVYMLALYDRALSINEINQNYNARLTNSVPLSYDISTTVNEDGEVVCGSKLNYPISYRSPIEPVSDLVTITFSVYDADNDVDHPNYDADLAAKYPTLVKITSLPTKGSIYQTQGSNEEVCVILFDGMNECTF
jgi:hypothetical protein